MTYGILYMELYTLRFKVKLEAKGMDICSAKASW